MAILQGTEIPLIIELAVELAGVVQHAPGRIHLRADIGVKITLMGEENLSPVLIFHILLGPEIAFQGQSGVNDVEPEQEKAVGDHALEHRLIVQAVPGSMETHDRRNGIPHSRGQKALLGRRDR